MNVYKWINTVALIAMIATNILANVIPIGGNTTGEVSASYPNLFTPAPITFAIWGVIYLFMTLFVIFQWGIMGNKVSSAYVRDRIGFLFVANCILNISWIIAWHNKKIEISMVLMILLLINLIFIIEFCFYR